MTPLRRSPPCGSASAPAARSRDRSVRSSGPRRAAVARTSAELSPQRSIEAARVAASHVALIGEEPDHLPPPPGIEVVEVRQERVGGRSPSRPSRPTAAVSRPILSFVHGQRIFGELGRLGGEPLVQPLGTLEGVGRSEEFCRPDAPQLHCSAPVRSPRGDPQVLVIARLPGGRFGPGNRRCCRCVRAANRTSGDLCLRSFSSGGSTHAQRLRTPCTTGRGRSTPRPCRRASSGGRRDRSGHERSRSSVRLIAAGTRCPSRSRARRQPRGSQRRTARGFSSTMILSIRRNAFG